VTNPAFLVFFGVVVGIYSGIMGLGGGTIMIPVMVLLMGMTQKEALGTSLAVMIPPVTLPAVFEYYRGGNVQLGKAFWIALGVAAGAYVGARIATSLSNQSLKLIFGFVLVYVGIYTAFGKENLVRTLCIAAVVTLLAVGLYAGTRWYDGAASPAAAQQQSPGT
jgi:hypothetical protein